jgi:hypothetical protein
MFRKFLDAKLSWPTDSDSGLGREESASDISDVVCVKAKYKRMMKKLRLTDHFYFYFAENPEVLRRGISITSASQEFQCPSSETGPRVRIPRSRVLNRKRALGIYSCFLEAGRYKMVVASGSICNSAATTNYVETHPGTRSDRCSRPRCGRKSACTLRRWHSVALYYPCSLARPGEQTRAEPSRARD